MKRLSSGMSIAWNIAAVEAFHAQHEFIEQEHILIGICSLKKVIDARGNSEPNSREWQHLQEEHADIECLFNKHQIDLTQLRRHLREGLGTAHYKHSENVVHRSEACKRLFSTAEKLTVMPTDEVACLHFIIAIMDSPGEMIENILNKLGAKSKEIWQSATSTLAEEMEDINRTLLGAHEVQTINTFAQNAGVSVFTIMYDDIVGSTALFNKMGNLEFLKLLKIHDKKIEEIIKRIGNGEKIKSTGDGLLMIFSSPSAAVQCAFSIQKEFASDQIIKLRVGMDIGEIHQVKNDKEIIDVLGLAVSTASRITSIAEQGHILASRPVYEAVKNEISNIPISWKYLGSRCFKPGEPTLDIYEVYDPEVIEPMPDLPAKASLPKKDNVKPSSETPFLDRFGRDLIREAREEKLGPFVGRRKELLQIIQTLARQSKNNPVLVGEAGVGKTAVVEALAVRVVQGKNPGVLEGKRIIELSMGALVAGTKYRGEFEDRLEQVKRELQNHPEVIVFIDEIHLMVGTGRAEGSMDAGNILKPALARGEFRCIGATTISEYRKYIESDPALERRFEKIIINEPSRDEAVEILKGVRSRLQEHHQVQITDQALEAAVDLSMEYDQEHHLPDKAIDLVDKAAARVRLPILSMGMGMDDPSKINENKEKISLGSAIVTEESIAEVLSEKSGVSLGIIMGHVKGDEKSRILTLEKNLKNNLIGQNEAIKRVCERLLMAYGGLSDRSGPLAVFLFLGPTGVGKTYLAKLLATFLFGDDSHIIRLDMSEFIEEHSVAKMIGSPPGYVGYEEEGQLTGKLRSKPHCVVLLDEIEKAHPKVFDIFLQLFDEGRLTDAKGKTVNAKNAIFIMTSNIPADKKIGFQFKDTEESKSTVISEIRSRFRPEFVNRIDEKVVFRPLLEKDVRKIIKPILERLNSDLQKKHNISLYITKEAEKYLASVGYHPDYGVRELHRTIERLVIIPLSSMIFKEEFRQSQIWELTYLNGQLQIDPRTDTL
jgi:ATP-dependent Clp protease ATP-binding subunit ClpC